MHIFFTRCNFYYTFVLLLLGSFSYAQTKIGGKVTETKTKEPLIGVSVQVKGKVIGTITDAKGDFSFVVNSQPPFTLVVSSVGFETQEINVSGNQTDFQVQLSEQAILGQEIIVSASRVEESVMKSPVAVEKMDIRGIRETPSPNFYDALANLKGIDMATQGVLFKSINMRGFGSTGNPRTVQILRARPSRRWRHACPVPRLRRCDQRLADRLARRHH